MNPATLFCAVRPLTSVRLSFVRGAMALLLACISVPTWGLGHEDRTAQSPANVDSIVAGYLASPQQTGWVSVIARLTRTDIRSGSHQLASEHVGDLENLGGYVCRHLPLAQAVAVRVPRRNLSRFIALPWVEHLSSDLETHKQDEFTVQGSGADIAFSQYGLSGNGVTVAVLDSGIAPVDDLGMVSNGSRSGSTGSSRIVATKDFVKVGNNNPVDECGHGTHVAGIIAGNGYASTGSEYSRIFTGVARRARLANVRVLDRQGIAPVSRVIAGLQWIVDNKNRYNIRVVNIALGHPVVESYTTDPLCQAVEAAWKAGIVVVCSAGNDGRLSAVPGTAVLDNEGFGTAIGSIRSPGNSPYVITVGAMKPANTTASRYDVSARNSDRIATYSGRGPTRVDFVAKPDLVAPGNRIISLQPGGNSELAELNVTHILKAWYLVNSGSGGQSGDYYVLSGTSMAAPVVAGAAALLLEQNPGLSPDTIKARLMLSADKWTLPSGKSDPFAFGAGYVNIPATLRNTAFVPANRYALSPVVEITDTGFCYLSPDPLVWGDSLWGTGIFDARIVWGPGTVTFNGLTEGTGAVWGFGNDVKPPKFALSIGSIGASGGAGAVDLSSIVLSGEP